MFKQQRNALDGIGVKKKWYKIFLLTQITRNNIIFLIDCRYFE